MTRGGFTSKQLGLSGSGDISRTMSLDMPIDATHLYDITKLSKMDTADREALVGALVESGITQLDPETGKTVPKRYTFIDIEILLLWEFLIGNIPKYRFYENMTIVPEYKKSTPKKFQHYRDNFAIDPSRFDEYLLMDKFRELYGDLEFQFVWRELASNFVKRDPFRRYEIMKSILMNIRHKPIRKDLVNIIRKEDDKKVMEYHFNIHGKGKERGRLLSASALLPCLIDKTRYKLKYVCGLMPATIEDILRIDPDRNAEYAKKLNSDTFALPFFTGPYAEKLVKLITV